MTNDPSIDVLADRLRAAIGDLAFHLRRLRQVAGVGGTGFSMLSRLYREGPQSQSQLAAADGVQPQSLTRALDTLESSGYIAKTADPTDGRKLVIGITGGGLAMLREDAQYRTAWLANAIDERTSESDRRTLEAAVDVLHRLADPRDLPDTDHHGRRLP